MIRYVYKDERMSDQLEFRTILRWFEIKTNASNVSGIQNCAIQNRRAQLGGPTLRVG